MGETFVLLQVELRAKWKLWIDLLIVTVKFYGINTESFYILWHLRTLGIEGKKVIECSGVVNQPAPSRHNSSINVKILLTYLQNGSRSFLKSY
jgi:hypothetical protein